MWENMDNRPAAWRVIFKSLSLCEHLIKNGSERCVDDARYHSHQLRSLENFNYYEGTVDRGIGVREKSKQVTELLGDDERIREERAKAKALREKFGGMTTSSSSSGDRYGGYGNSGGGGSLGFGKDGFGKEGFGSSQSGGGYGDSSSYGGSGGGIGGEAPGYSGRYSDSQTNSVSKT